MKIKRKIIKINEKLCDGCGQCVIACAEGAIEIIDGKAKVLFENLCDGLGTCIGICPQNALKIIENEAKEFNVKAVERHLENKKETLFAEEMPYRCPLSNIESFSLQSSSDNRNDLNFNEPTESALTHWPIQIRLVPSDAPFLKGSDLLVVANCVPLAFPGLNNYFLKGRTIMIGCPKFDDHDDYIEKFKQVFILAGLKSITCLIMKVPCCSSFSTIIEKALEASGEKIPLEIVTINNRGKIVETI